MKDVMDRWLSPWLFTAVLIALLCGDAARAQSDLAGLGGSIDGRKTALEAIEEALSESDAAQLVEFRAEARAIRLETETLTERLSRRLGALNAERDALGPAPAEDATAEPDDVASLRVDLTGEYSETDALLRQSKFNAALADRLLTQIADRRRSLFYHQILVRGLSPLNPELMIAGWAGLVDGWTQTTDWLQREINLRDYRETLQRDLVLVGLAFLAALVLVWPVRAWLDRRIEAYMSAHDPTDQRMVIVATIRAMARLIPGLIGGIIVLTTLRQLEIIHPERPADQVVAQIVWIGILALLTVDAATDATVAQRRVGWRLLPLDPYNGFLVRLLFMGLTCVIAFDAILRQAVTIHTLPQSTTLLISGVATIIISLAFILGTRPSVWRKPEDLDPEKSSYLSGPRSWIPVVGLITGLALIGATLIGFVALAYFVSTRILLFFGLIAVLTCLRSVLREGIAALSGSMRPKAGGPVTTPTESALAFWSFFTLDLMLVVMALIPAALLVGAEWAELRDLAIDAFFGIKIGPVTLSLADVMAAIAVLVFLMWLTRRVQSAAETRFLPRTGLDEGARQSMRTLIGYFGIALACLAGISTAGLDLSNLAIVAGALSVGIGFGLQSIVSNFVSGLILLFERPIKVGDWIVVASGQGYVKRISVRSTEIETFEKSSIIVPNSELISGTVTNLTFGNKQGRVLVPVGVSYDADPDRVIEILEEVTRAHPKIMSYPAPFINFAGLGDSALNFEMRGFVRDVNDGFRVQHDLRLTVFKRLKEEGIEIPFPQRVVTVRTEGPVDAATLSAAAD